jgi:hypothetical protein
MSDWRKKILAQLKIKELYKYCQKKIEEKHKFCLYF